MKTNVILPIVSLLILSLGCTKPDTQKVTIATAANMQFAIHKIAQSFTQQTGVPCDIIVSSSGKLTAQIKEGAPYDIFVSADTKYPEILYKNELTTALPETYAYGKLVLWSMSKDIKPDLETLTDTRINHIALANPKTAPYGEAAVSVLKHVGIYDQIADKLVYGESISQTNQFIVSGAAEIGFTAKSVVLSPKMKGKGNWISLEDKSYTPIEQGVVIIQKELVTEHTLKFYEFLFSTKSKEILKNFGYLVLEK